MDSITLLTRLNKISERLLDISFCKEELTKLIAEIKLDEETKALPKESINIAKAAAKFALYCYNGEHDKHEGIAGANLYHDKRDSDPEVLRQYICDGYVCVSYSKPFDGLIKATGDPLDINRVLRHAYVNFDTTEIVLPSLARLKQSFKLEKATKGAKFARNLLRLSSGKVVSIQFLTRLMELCGLTGGETAYDVLDLRCPLFVENITEDGNEISGTLLPIHPAKATPENILIDYYGNEVT